MPNEVNLGCAKNIDQAFRRQGFVLDYEYACVLEDDNWFSSDFLKCNIQLMKQHDVALVLHDQYVVHEESDGFQIGPRTTRDMMRDGLWTKAQLMPQMVFHCGLSNGGLMWRRDVRTNLVVGDFVENSSFQEQLRSLQLAEPFWFSREPLAFFRFNAKGFSRRGLWERACLLRTRQEIARRILGFARPDFWSEARMLAEQESLHEMLDAFALMVGNWRHQPSTIRPANWWIRQVRHAVVRQFAVDRLRPYWKNDLFP